MQKKKKQLLFNSNLQIFAAIAWLLVFGYATYDALEYKWPIESYLGAIGLLTSICILAWGLPFPGKSSYPKPYEVGKNEKYPWNVNPWLAWFVAVSAFLFWVGASFTGRLYTGGFSAVGIWAFVMICVWTINRLIKRKKAKPGATFRRK
jgi:hypothetical protein